MWYSYLAFIGMYPNLGKSSKIANDCLGFVYKLAFIKEIGKVGVVTTSEVFVVNKAD